MLALALALAGTGTESGAAAQGWACYLCLVFCLLAQHAAAAATICLAGMRV